MALKTWKASAVQATDPVTYDYVATVLRTVYDLMTANAADASFKWEVKGHSFTAPSHVTIGRKDGSPGRLFIVGDHSATCIAAAQWGRAAAMSDRPMMAWHTSSTANAPAADYTVDTIMPYGPNFTELMPFVSVNGSYATRMQYFELEGDALAFNVGDPNLGISMAFAGGFVESSDGTILEGCWSTGGSGTGNFMTNIGGVAYYETFNPMSCDTWTINRYTSNSYWHECVVAGVSGQTQPRRLVRFSGPRDVTEYTGMVQSLSEGSKFNFIPLLMYSTSDIIPRMPLCRLRQMGYGPASLREVVLPDADNGGADGAFALGYSTSVPQTAWWLFNKEN